MLALINRVIDKLSQQKHMAVHAAAMAEETMKRAAADAEELQIALVKWDVEAARAARKAAKEAARTPEAKHEKALKRARNICAHYKTVVRQLEEVLSIKINTVEALSCVLRRWNEYRLGLQQKTTELRALQAYPTECAPRMAEALLHMEEEIRRMEKNWPRAGRPWYEVESNLWKWQKELHKTEKAMAEAKVAYEAARAFLSLTGEEGK